MCTRSFKKWALLALIAAAALIPAAALAGKKAVSGKQSLQLKITLTPAKAGATGVGFHLRSDYKSTEAGGGQVPYNTKSITLKYPKGMTFHPNAAGSCKESATIKSSKGGAVCSASSKVGTGTVVVNARPTVPKLITGKVTEYNGVDDKAYGGFPKNSPLLILYIKSSIGVNGTYYFHVAKRGGSYELINGGIKPKKPGVAPGSFTIQTLDVTVSKPGYITNPPTCHGSWPFSLTFTNFFGQPSVTALDSVKCKK